MLYSKIKTFSYNTTYSTKLQLLKMELHNIRKFTNKAK